MKLKLLFTLLIAACIQFATAQDIIIKKNGDEVQAKVINITTDEIKYKRWDNPSGPDYTINKSDAFMIKYADGSKLVFNPKSVSETVEERYQDSVRQYRMFKDNSVFLCLGYGVGTGTWYYSSGLSNRYYDPGNDNRTTTGPFYVKFEYGISQNWSLGINLAYMEHTSETTIPGYYYNSYSYSSTSVNYIYHYTYTSFSGLFRANWHFATGRRIDPYFGFGLGYRTAQWTTKTNDPGNYYYYNTTYYNNDNSFPLGFETTVGMKVKFAEHVGAYFETGIAKSVIQGGLMIQF